MIPRICATLIVTILIAAAHPAAVGDTPQPVVRLGQYARGLAVGPDMDARTRDLRGSKIVGQDLSGANFAECDLFGLTIEDCKLSGASFHRATLTGATLIDCEIEGADFTDAILNGVLGTLTVSEEQLISTASYKNGDLSDCRIRVGPDSQLSFRNMELQRTVFVEGDFTGCDFRDANIFQARFGRIRINSSQLRETRHAPFGRFSDLEFSGTLFLDKVDFSGMSLTGSKLSWVGPEVNVRGADISGCRIFRPAITKDQLVVTKSFIDGNLSGVSFRKLDLSGVDFSGQNLTNARFSSCDLHGAIFSDAVITNADFTRARAVTMQQLKATWNFRNKRFESILVPESFQNEFARLASEGKGKQNAAAP